MPLIPRPICLLPPGLQAQTRHLPSAAGSLAAGGFALCCFSACAAEPRGGGMPGEARRGLTTPCPPAAPQTRGWSWGEPWSRGSEGSTGGGTSRAVLAVRMPPGSNSPWAGTMESCARGTTRARGTTGWLVREQEPSTTREPQAGVQLQDQVFPLRCSSSGPCLLAELT